MNQPVDLGKAHLRAARPTDNLAAVVKFYRDGLGMEVLGTFQNHEGFDGVMLGCRGAAFHLEFTRKFGHRAGPSPTEENLLVFYLPDKAQWQAAMERLWNAGYKAVRSFNPYWDKSGRTFEDPDGYRVVLQNGGWEPVLALEVSTIATDPAAIIDACIGRANEAERLAEAGAGDFLYRELALESVGNLLRNDTSGTVANLVISRIDTMELGVRWSLMREAVEWAEGRFAPLVIHLLATTMAALRWDGHGWLEDIPQPTTETLAVAKRILVSTLMIVEEDWGDPVRQLQPLLACDDQAICRAAWVALRSADPMSHAPFVTETISAGLSSADSIVRSHAEHMVARRHRTST
jgi:catechol 2,3-dioxygenase-like lactoylglutathione lyase family enzyme